MTKQMRSSKKQTQKQGGKFLPALCGFLGTLIILLVIVVCLPLTLPRFRILVSARGDRQYGADDSGRQRDLRQAS